MRSVVIVLLLFSSLAAPAAHPSVNVGPSVVADSVYVVKSVGDDTEKDYLVISRNGGIDTLYTLYTGDGSSLEFLFRSGNKSERYDCFESYNAATGGVSLLFYNWPENILYITGGVYMECDLIPGSVDFVGQVALLKSRQSTPVSQDDQSGGSEGSGIIRVELTQIRPLAR